MIEVGRVESRNTHFILAAVLLVAMTVTVYWPVMKCGYIWDDDYYVHNNQNLRSIKGLGRIWFQIGATPQYYPMVHTTFWLEYRVWKLDPRGYHVVNVLLHGISALLLWRLLIFLKVPGAWMAAAVFALHPVHVESVAWITERKNVLSGVFYLTALFVYLRYARGTRKGKADLSSTDHGSGWLYALSLVLFATALLSKTVTCTLPAALLLLVWWKHGRIGWWDVRPLVPFFVMGIALGLLTAWIETHSVGAAGKDWDLSFVERGLIAGRAIWFYAGKLTWPEPLIFFYERWMIDAGAWWQYLYPAATVGVVVALWQGRGRIGRGPLVAFLFFAGTLFPALGFFNVYPMRFSFVADHFQYLASMGLITLFTASGAMAVKRFGSRVKGVGVVLAVIVLATLGTLTWRQGPVYSDVETLWRDTIKKNNNAWLAHYNLGNRLKAQGKIEGAIQHYLETIRVKPEYDRAHYNLGQTLHLEGRIDEAIKYYRQTIEINPNHASAHHNLALALDARGRHEEANHHSIQAQRIPPSPAEWHHAEGTRLQSEGRREEAITHFRKAVLITPDYPEAHNSLGIALDAEGRYDEAINHFRQALHVMPGFAPALYNLALTLRSQGNLEEAISHFRQALKYAPDAPITHYGLGETLIMTGQVDEGRDQLEEALELATSKKSDALVLRIRAQLERFGQGGVMGVE